MRKETHTRVLKQKLTTMKQLTTMKRITFLLVAMCFTTAMASAQNYFAKGAKVINATVGFGNSLYTGSGYTGKVPPIAASFEVGILDNVFDEKSSIGVGGYLGYTSAKWELGGYGWRYSDFIIGVRGSFHYQLIDKMDTYTGLLLGYDIVRATEIGDHTLWSGSSALSSGLAWSWYVGGRYYFNDKFAGLVELGYGIAYFNIGLSIKF